jgi:CTP-dependent riboflavin kinase
VPWVKNQFSCKLAIEAYPGTLNLEITESEDLKALESLKAREGIEITPEQPSFCSAKCFPVLIAGEVKGAILFPCVDNYPKNKMEIIASVHVRKALSLYAGDILEVEIL